MRARTGLILVFLLSGCAALPPIEPVGRVEAPADEAATAPRRIEPSVVAPAHAHPRLMAGDEDLARVKRLVASDAQVAKWWREILDQAETDLHAPAIHYKPAKGIECARQLQNEVTHLALAWRMTGRAEFLDKASQELGAACQWPSWEKPSFLADAETTTAAAIGYDWLYSGLSAGDRSALEQAIVDKGLRPGLLAYDSHDQSWVEAHHNWNLVCNAGMMIGALAVIDDSPAVAGQALNRARGSIVNGLEGFAPDGGWEEGPTYWNYGTRYVAMALSSLRETFGTMDRLDEYPGVARTGEFRMHTLGPTGLNFNFADSSEAPGDCAQMFAMGWAFNRPDYSAWERNRTLEDPSVFDLLWYQPAEAATTQRTDPTGDYFRGVELAAFRGAWNDPNATYIAFKGGNNRAHHGHLDLGTFVLDALGQRWAIDLGSENYDLPAKDRWNYYRYSTRGHNTLTFNDENQPETAEAPLILFSQSPARSQAAVDLTQAYRGYARQALRGIALLDDKDVLIQDDILPAGEPTVQWSMHTRAAIEVNGSAATLRQNGKVLHAAILSPAEARFEVESAYAPPPQNPNTGISKLIIRIKCAGPTRIAVLLWPGTNQPPAVKLSAISTWAP